YRMRVGDLIGPPGRVFLDQLPQRRLRFRAVTKGMINARERPKAVQLLRLSHRLRQRLLALTLGKQCPREAGMGTGPLWSELQRLVIRHLRLLEPAGGVKRVPEIVINRCAQRVLLQRPPAKPDCLLKATQI